MCATPSERSSSFARSLNSAFIPFEDYTRPTIAITRHVPALQDTERIETSAVAESVEPLADAIAVKASYPGNITPQNPIAPEVGPQWAPRNGYDGSERYRAEFLRRFPDDEDDLFSEGSSTTITQTPVLTAPGHGNDDGAPWAPNGDYSRLKRDRNAYLDRFH